MLEQDVLRFSWQCQPQARELVHRYVHECIEKSSFLKWLEKKLLETASVHLFDLVDHVEIGYSDELDRELMQTGFTSELVTPFYRVFCHSGAQLPRLVMRDQPHPLLHIGLIVESIADFLLTHGIHAPIEGSPLSAFRRALVTQGNGVLIYVVERRATSTMEPTYFQEDRLSKMHEAYEKWATRPRLADDEIAEEAEFRYALLCAEEIVSLIGQPLAAAVVLEQERRYWQAKNSAGQIQKNRQDRLGFGWANHDHHTFRSSRKHFQQLVKLFEILGFHTRERFYAGNEAGWGAQVMEHSQTRLVLFLDVDLAPHELEVDFSHHSLPELQKLGTIGLWCALHGESILKSGMHHLEAQFIFTQLKEDLHQFGVAMMSPFSDLPYLKQAFTVGETWQVTPKRIESLMKKGQITQEQADHFLLQGALGSHLENLERHDGYKGFNQKNVSAIIKKTDPRYKTGA